MLIMVLSPVNIFELLPITFFIHMNPARYCDKDFSWEFSQFIYHTHTNNVPSALCLKTCISARWKQIAELCKTPSETGTNFCQISSLNISNLNISVQGGEENGCKSQFCMISLKSWPKHICPQKEPICFLTNLCKKSTPGLT